MSRVSRYRGLARKALTRPPAHVARRIGRELRTQAERPWVRVRPALLSDHTVCKAVGCGSAEGLADALNEAPFFSGARDGAALTAARLRVADPEHVAAITGLAEGVLRHEFDLLGSGPRTVGPCVPWRSDFKTGAVWPRRYAFDLDYETLTPDSDVKVPWELSRFQHAAWLGQAWLFTGRHEFRTEFVQQFEDWQRENPWGYSVNWICAMDVAIRAHNLQWAVRLFQRPGDPLASDFLLALTRALYLHGEFVERHLEVSDVNGNHYLADGVGLVSVGMWFRGSAAGRRWVALGRRILEQEIFRQVHSDGVDFEQSTAYHRFVTEMFLTGFLLLRAGGEELEASAWDRLHRMFEYIAAYTRPDGCAPLIGDADDGRMQKLGTADVNDHRYLLSTGACLFEDAPLASAAGRCWPETVWLLGADAPDRFAALSATSTPRPGPVGFPAAGIYILRAPDAHAFIDCAEVGMRGRGGHGHNDILSFELSLGGASIVTDCGSYVYTADVSARDRFRSTASHNGVQVDDQEVNRFLSPPDLWRLADDARPRDVRWRPDVGGGLIDAGHTGYDRLPDPVSHRRTCALDETGAVFVVRDDMNACGSHRYTWRFHLSPRATARVEPAEVVIDVDGRTVRLTWQSELAVTPRLEQGDVSPSYGVRVPAVVVCADVVAAGPVRVRWIFSLHTAIQKAASIGERLLGAA